MRSELATTPLETRTQAGSLRLARWNGELPTLLIPVDMAANLPAQSGVSGVAFCDSNYAIDGQLVRCLEVRCADERLTHVYEAAVGELVRRIAEGQPPIASAAVTVEEFRQLFMRATSTTVDRKLFIGMAGELLILRRLLKKGCRTVECWTGPSGGRDFRTGSAAIEVKTQLDAAEHVVHINGLEQLDISDGRPLHLAVLQLESGSAAPLTIPDLIDEIRVLAAVPPGLEQRLSILGYDESTRTIWERPRFEERSMRLYEVRDGFPRIVPASFPNGRCPSGIKEVEYSLRLDALTQFEVDANEAERILTGFAACAT